MLETVNELSYPFHANVCCSGGLLCIRLVTSISVHAD